MLTSLTHPCFLLAIISVFQPALQKSVETGSGEAFSSVQTRRRREVVNDAIHFPAETRPADKDVINRGGMSQDLSAPSPCPNGLSFCDSTDDYPKDLIKEMLKKQPKLLLDHIYVEEDSEEDVYNKFDSDDPSDTPLCASVKRTVFPTKAQSNEGLFFVVNDDEYRQGVKVESCMGDRGQCQIPGSLSNGYTSRCVQRYIVRTLVVLRNASDVEGFVTKPFDFPSCCSCVVSMSSSRFGVGAPFLGSGSPVNSNTTAATPSKPKNTKS